MFEIVVSNVGLHTQSKSRQHSDDATTRSQLLDAAAEVFTSAGFRAATVREICQRAGANIAAVNYHFGDKEALYAAVLAENFRSALAKYPLDYGLPPNATPEQRLRAFVHSFLLRIFSDDRAARHGKLVAHEMIDPTGALDIIVQESIRPTSAALFAILKDILGPDTPMETLRLCGMSVVSQILHYFHCRPVVNRLFPEMKFDPASLEKLADHITRFSLAGMRQMPSQMIKSKTRPKARN